LSRCESTEADCMNAEKYKQAADELSERITHLSVVSQDTAYREGFNLHALRRAQHAAEEDKVFLSGQRVAGVLVLGIHALGQEKAEKFIAACGGRKSCANWALLELDGEKGEIRLNRARTCWVIDLASPRREVMFGWTAHKDFHKWSGTRCAGPRLNTTNGGGHWCGLVSPSMPFNKEISPNTVEFIQRAVSCFTEHGMTLRQWHEAESARRKAEDDRYAEVVRAAIVAGEFDDVTVRVGFGYNPTRGGEYIAVAEEIAGTAGPVATDLAEKVHARVVAKRQAEDEARIMAELEAEQARLADEKAKADSEVKRQAEIAATCAATGISATEWQGMTSKQQRLALHRARLAHKI